MLEQFYLHQKQYCQQLRKESRHTRLESLKNLMALLDENHEAICEALYQDFKKPAFESLLTEIYPLIHEIKAAQKNLKKWMKPEKISTPLGLLGARSEVRPEPKGVVLVISPWNYPVYLTLGPVISALAAGNCVIVKPSEHCRHTSALLTHLVAKYFRPELLHFIPGGPETTTALLKFPFDHIFYTGSTRVGRIIMEAAARHLTPVTLELGGKSPTIVDHTADLELAARKIIWAKFLNGGQTCVAPDYLFVQESVIESFNALLIENLKKHFGPAPYAADRVPDLARMIHHGHAERLKNLLVTAQDQGAQVLYGGETDTDKNFIAPTLLTKVSMDSPVMQEEIFGPLLPIHAYREIKDVIHFINDRAKPLALYMYSNAKLDIEKVLSETSSGGVVINDSVVHVGNPHLPFGGVGESGMGRSHGKYGFRTFSNEKAILRQGLLSRLTEVPYPPYTEGKFAFIKRLIRWRI